MADKKEVVAEAKKLITSKKYTYKQVTGSERYKDDFMDCSEFVYTAHVNAGFSNFPTKDSHGMAAKFKTVTQPEAGDIVYWSKGHVGIIEDPEKGTFLGAQSSGLAQSNYKTNVYWSKQEGRKFLRYEQ